MKLKNYRLKIYRKIQKGMLHYMGSKTFFLSILLLLNLILVACSTPEKTDKIVGESVTGSGTKPLSFKKIAPLTTNALGAHKNIHENGWVFIPSGKDSLEAAIESSRMSSRVAKAILFTKMKKRSEYFPERLLGTMKKINELGTDVRSSGTSLSKSILEISYVLTIAEWQLSESFKNDAERKLIYGYVEFGDREEEDRNQIISTLSEVNQERSKISGSLNDLFMETALKNQTKLTTAWKSSYTKSIQGFMDNYDASAKRENSLVAIWDIFQGYTVAIKEAVISPIFDTTTAIGETVIVNGVFVPVSHTATFSGQALITSGLVLYYPAKLGYRVISPSLEAGLLGTMGLASLSATAPTMVSGAGISAFNQITTMTAGYGGEAIAQTGGVAVETTAYASGLVYDFASGTAESSVYGLKSGLILSYTALTALPAHLLLSVPDGTIFLTYDGPRVVIAVARGNYAGFEDLPTGMIVDLEEAKKKGRIEILTRDPKLIRKVIEAEIKEREDNLKRKKTEAKK